MQQDSTWETCNGCHAQESVRAHELSHMAPARRDAALARARDGEGAPLVRDWMVEDERGCLDCHRLRKGRAR